MCASVRSRAKFGLRTALTVPPTISGRSHPLMRMDQNTVPDCPGPGSLGPIRCPSTFGFGPKTVPKPVLNQPLAIKVIGVLVASLTYLGGLLPPRPPAGGAAAPQTPSLILWGCVPQTPQRRIRTILLDLFPKLLGRQSAAAFRWVRVGPLASLNVLPQPFVTWRNAYAHGPPARLSGIQISKFGMSVWADFDRKARAGHMGVAFSVCGFVFLCRFVRRRFVSCRSFARRFHQKKSGPKADPERPVFAGRPGPFATGFRSVQNIFIANWHLSRRPMSSVQQIGQCAVV
jgi:hypothetical protein